MAVERMVLESPETFGKFVLLERIGAGGMAEVFRATTAWAEGVAKEVCVKRMLPPLSGDARLRELFIQEARIVASLSHANIVSVHEFGVIDSYYFLAMEYVEGHTLRELMMRAAATRRWPQLATVLHIAAEALEGLDYAHRKRDSDGRPLRIVHRDITPGNIIISRAGEVKLLDFGIGAMDAAEASSSRPEMFGRGKPGYVAPEQAAGLAVDRRADIFSLGVILYELLARRRLFKGVTMEERLERRQQIRPPSALRRGLSADLDPIVLRALAPSPGDRYADGAALRDALLDYMHEKGLRAGRSQLAETLEQLFAAKPGDEPPRGRRYSWEVDMRELRSGEELARQPPPARSRASTRPVRVSGEAEAGLDRALERRGRWRVIMLSLVVTLGIGVLLVYWLLSGT